MHGGQTVNTAAPIDTIPLYVKAGSILPLGSPIESTHDTQTIAKIKIYPGASSNFTLYNDDGFTYAYEQGNHAITTLHWDDSARKLTQQGAKAYEGDGKQLIEIIGQ